MFAKLKSIREEQESGFTLIELLVVILIIGILAAIAIPMFLNQRKSAVDSSVQSDLKNAATQVETWMVKNPSGVPDVTSTVGTKTLADVKVSSNTLLKIRSSGVGTYVLCATNTGGDIANTANGFQYDSANGGLKAGTSTCA